MARPSIPVRPMSSHFGSSSNSAFTPVQSYFGQLSSRLYFTSLENRLESSGNRHRERRVGKFSESWDEVHISENGMFGTSVLGLGQCFGRCHNM